MRDFLTGLQRSLFLTQGCSVISVNYLELNEALLMKSADAFKTAQGHLGWGPLSDLNHVICVLIHLHGKYLCIKDKVAGRAWEQKYKACFWAGSKEGK